jgi:hypothetical protein
LQVRAERAWSAGGSSRGTAGLLMWDAQLGELLCSLDGGEPWLKSPVTAMVLVEWDRLVGAAQAEVEVSGEALALDSCSSCGSGSRAPGPGPGPQQARR